MKVIRLLFATLTLLLAVACGNSGAATQDSGPTAAPIVRRGFLGAFFRPVGPPPFGVFSAYSKQRAPEPYPNLSTNLFGTHGYCDAVADNGLSISSGYTVDAKKLANIVDLGVAWTRTAVSPNFDDQSHIFGPGRYSFADFDSAQCALLRHRIVPIVGIEGGTVQYNAVAEQYSPTALPNYKTAADFGQWCGVVATHEMHTFRTVSRYSLPGNEVNSDQATWPGGDAQIASYAQACYRAIKAVDPHAFVYGFELNMDKHVDGPGFVGRMYDLGCKVGTCYDAVSIHMFMPYPLPAADSPCYPNYSLECVTEIQKSAHDPSLHVLIGETAFLIPATVPDEATKAKAVVEAMRAFASVPAIDGVNYANVDECDLYSSGYFVGGCLVDSLGHRLPAYTALEALAKSAY